MPRLLWKTSSLRPTLLALGLLAGVAEAEPTLSLQPGTARPGDPVLVTVRGLAAEPSGTLDGRPLRFFKVGDGFQSLTGLPVEQAAGPVQVKVTAPPAESAPAVELTEALEVQAPAWRVRELKVESKYTEPPPEVKARMAEDKAAFAAAFAQPFAAPLFARNFDWPRQARVTAPFGDKRTFNGAVASQHFGTDLDGKTGTPILSANDGTVVMARENQASGNTVLVHHGGGLYTAYFHMSRIQVKEGDTVKRGQRLGLVGNTGRVTGPHLHWGAKVDDRWVDPEALLKLDFFDARAVASDAGR
jgi:murein DD-endopeptidase MepM/ murein hydrolase activator NlpD